MRVSVLLPCRDAEAFLPACIASLEAQTEPRFEIVTLDDGSRDGTGALLEAWAARDERVRLVRPRGRGIVAALAQLTAAARAPLLARMDADDVARPDRLHAQLSFLARHPEVAACGTGVRYFPRQAAGSGYRRYERWLNALARPTDLERDLFVECPIAHPTLMLRRAALDAVGGYRETEGPEDYDLVLRLAAAGCRLANVPEVLHDWRLGPHRLSERSPRYAPDAFRRLKIAFLAAGPVPPERPLAVWGAGRVGKAFARAWRGSGSRLDAFVDLDPRKIGQVIHGAPVLPLDALTRRLRQPYVLIAVGAPGARGEVRAALGALGLAEIDDFRAVA